MKPITMPRAAAVLLALSVVASQALADDFTNIPVVINILKNSGVTEEAAKKAVSDASEALKDAKIKLTVVKVNVLAENDGDDGSGGATAGDAVLKREERTKVRETGSKEIEKTDNKKGIKITFAKTPQAESPTNPGISVHRDPTVIVKELGDAAKSGQTIAHEIAHALTLGPGHKIDATITADAGGHAPDKAGKSGKENLMAPSDYRTGTNLTADQIKTIRDDKFLEKVGKTVEKELKDAKSVGEKRQQQYGVGTDRVGDQTANAPAYFDLFRTAISSELGRGSIDVLMNLAGTLPVSGAVDATYRLLVNADANAATGISAFGFSGIDKQVLVHLYGDASTGPLGVSGMVIDTASGIAIPLPSVPLLLAGEELTDLTGPADVVESQIGFEVPKALLDLSTLHVPMATVAEGVFDLGSGVFDTSPELSFDLDRFARDARLTMPLGEFHAGQLFPFSLAGLLANSPFDLFLDEDLVFSGLLDSLGGFSGSFLFPADSPSSFYFLTAQDATGEFAFNVVAADEPPLLVWCALLILVAQRAGRRRSQLA